MSPPEIKRLADNILPWIGDFLHEEGIPHIQSMKQGILLLIEEIQNYREEGERLNPELFITTSSVSDISPHLTPCRIIEIGTLSLNETSFRIALKKCAPLAESGWVIFLSIVDGNLAYGVVSSEVSELSASVYSHLVGPASADTSGLNLVYIKAIGSRAVEISGSRRSIIFSLSVASRTDFNQDIEKLSAILVREMQESDAALSKPFFSRLLEEAARESHGCLIGVIKEESLSVIKETLSDGSYISPAINFIEHIKASEENDNRQASTALRSYAAVVKKMISHDGVAILTTNGSVVAYNVFITGVSASRSDESGGARTRAYKAMKELGIFECCFFKSHDGRMDIWERRDASV